jgi:hypothetical protein
MTGTHIIAVVTILGHIMSILGVVLIIISGTMISKMHMSTPSLMILKIRKTFYEVDYLFPFMHQITSSGDLEVTSLQA